MEQTNRLSNDLQAFLEILRGNIEFQCFEFNLDELRKDDRTWKVWQNFPGIYYFVEDGRIVYVGRALLGTGLGSRVHQQMNSFGDPKWDRVINNEKVIVGVVCLSVEMWYLASSLEAYLIEKLRPEFNARRQ